MRTPKDVILLALTGSVLGTNPTQSTVLLESERGRYAHHPLVASNSKIPNRAIDFRAVGSAGALAPFRFCAKF